MHPLLLRQIQHHLGSPDAIPVGLRPFVDAIDEAYERHDRDITERQRTERTLRERQERYELAVAGSHDGLWDWDLRSGRVFLTPRFWSVLGHEGETDEEFDVVFNALLHPDDNLRVQDALAAHLEGRSVFDETARLRHADGGWRWFQVRGQARRDLDGVPLRMAGSIRDISEVKAKEEELERARDAAETASRAKDDFLANVSHEIRTPMNAITGLSHLLASGELRPREKAYADGMLEAGRTLLALINDLFDVTRIEENEIVLAPLTFDLRTTLRELFAVHRDRARTKGLAAELVLAPDLPVHVFADPGRLRQLLHNILDNAVKFTPRGSVTFEVAPGGAGASPEMVAFRVRDTGIGIPADRLGELGQKFTQLDARSTRRHGGTGIGLAISSHVVRLMGGTLRVESEEGSGSCFTVALPLPRRDDDSSARTPFAAPERLVGLRALVVCDDPALLERLEGELRGGGMLPEPAATLAEALARLEEGGRGEHPFDVVVFHDRTPDHESEAAVRTLKRNPRLRDTVAGVVVSLGAVGEAARLSEAGMAFYLTFPLAPGDVRDAVAAAWEMERVQRRRLLVTRHTLAEERGRGRGVAAAPRAVAVPTPVRAQVVVAPSEPTPAMAGARILVVDDNEINRAVAGEMLQLLGYVVELADGGERGVQMAASGAFAVILMDVQMPGVDGFEATRRIREGEAARGGGRHTPIIAVTANALPADRARALQAGMDDFLPKPVSRTRLQEMVDRWLQSDRVDGATGAPGANASNASNAVEGPGAARAHEAIVVPDAVPADASEILDVAQLTSIVGDDPARVGDFARLFVQLTEPMLAALREAVDARDQGAVRRQAHKLKGSCGNAGARRMATLAATAERVAADGGDGGDGGNEATLDATALALVRAFEDVKRVAGALGQPAGSAT